MTSRKTRRPNRHAPKGDSRRGPAQARRGWKTPLVVGLAVVGSIGVAWAVLRQPPPVTTLPSLDQHDPELVKMIKRHVAAARKDPRDARVRATLGLVYEANKLWTAARSCYENAALLDPDEPMWPHHAAIARMKTGEMEGVRSWLEKYTNRFPAFAPMQFRYGVMLLEAGELERAQAVFRKVITLAPESPTGYVALGEAILQAGDPAAAADMLVRALEIDGSDKMARFLLGRAYRALGRMEESQRELTIGRGASRRYLADSWSVYVSEYDTSVGGKLSRAAQFLEQGEPSKAVDTLRLVLSSDPDNLDALINLGAACLHMDRLEEARQTLERAADLDTNRFEVYVNLAACLRRLELPNDALVHADRAVFLAPDVAQTNHARGLVLMMLGSNEEALISLVKAADLDVRNARIRQDLANVYVRLGQHEEALGQFQVLAELLPLQWEPQLGLARMNLLLGRTEEAIAAVTAGLKLAPEEPRLQALARRIMEKHGQ